MERDPVIAALDLKAASPAVWGEIERLRAALPIWHQITTATPNEEVLLYFPETRSGRSILPSRIKVGRPMEQMRQPTYWMPLPPAPVSES